MTHSSGTLPDAIRERIAMVRVLCIGFMIYVHVPDNAFSTLASAGVPLPSLLLQGFVIEGVGRASAALLSLVSGLLTAVALARGDAPSLYRRRFRSIVVPMLLWSSLTVALYALITVVRPTFLSPDGRSLPEALLYYANTVFFLSAQPMGPTLHLGFLRDLFACVLLAPLMLLALRRVGALVPVAFGVLYLVDAESVLILRPLIPFAFSIGLWMAVRGARLDALDSAWPLWISLSLLATLAVMLSGSEWGLGSAVALGFAEHGFDFRESVVYPISRLFGALAIWTLAAKLVGTPWNARLARLSSYVFVAFCSHFLVLTFLWEGAIRPLVGAGDTVGYALWFVVAPFVAMAAAVLIVEVAARLVPALARLITGGRVSAPSGLAASRRTAGATNGGAPARESVARASTGRAAVQGATASAPTSAGASAAAVDPERRRTAATLAARDSLVGTNERRPDSPERAEIALETVADDDR